MSTIHKVGHGLSADDPIMFANVEPTDTGIDETATYYVIASGLTADDFKFSESIGGAEFDFATDITAGTVTDPTYYAPVADGTMDPPTTPVEPDEPVVTSELVSGLVRLVVPLSTTTEAHIRETEVQVTHKFDGNGDPDFTTSAIYSFPAGSTELTIPAMGSTAYAVRARYQDVFGGVSAWSTTGEHTTLAGSDALAAALASLANDVSDGIITETKIADDSISTPKLQAGAVTAEILAAVIVLGSLIKTADSGRRVEIDVSGITLYDTDESPLVRIPTNGDPVYVAGQVDASSLITNDSAEFRTLASLASNAVMTLQNGVSAPQAPPTLTLSVDALALTSIPANLGYGIFFDTAGGAGGTTDTFWLGADPSVSSYVAHEYNAATGALLRSITKTGSVTTYTATLGSTSHVSDGANGRTGDTDSHFATPLTIPAGLDNVRITSVAVWLAGRLGTASCRNAVYDDVSGTGNVLRETATYTAADEGATGAGDSHLYNKALSSELSVTSGATYYFGARRTSSSTGWQWDFDSGSSKYTYLGDDASDADGTGWGLYSSSQKPNVYCTYKYDVDTTLEGYTGKIIGVTRSGSDIWVLETTGILYRYDQSTLAYIEKYDMSSHISGTLAQGGLFYGSSKVVICNFTGTGAGKQVQFVLVNTDGTYNSTISGSGLTCNGTTDTVRGGYHDGTDFWVALTGTQTGVYAFDDGTGANVTNRHFGVAGEIEGGVTFDDAFRGYSSTNPTSVWDYTAWDWTTESAVYWVGYAWYDSAGTTHETAIGPRNSVTMRRRARLQVVNAAIPTGGADDPDKVRVYAYRGASDPGAGNFKRQAEDALTTRYLTTYDTGGGADGAGTAFPAGTPAELRSSVATGSGGWSLKGSGLTHLGSPLRTGGTSFPASPSTNDLYYRTDLGMLFYYDGSRWLCTCLHTMPLEHRAGVTDPITATTAAYKRSGTPYLTAAGIYITDWVSNFYVAGGGTALSGSHKWAVDFNGTGIDGGGGATFVSQTINSGSSGQHRRAVVAVNQVVDLDSHSAYEMDATKTGTPGGLYLWPQIHYRHIAT